MSVATDFLLLLSDTYDTHGHIRVQLAGAAVPGATDDESDYYGFGSLWFYDDRAWMCVNATTGAAVWREIGQDLTHNHDADYADIAHDHDTDYADIAHTHQGWRVVQHPEIVDPPEPLWLDGDWLYLPAEDWD